MHAYAEQSGRTFALMQSAFDTNQHDRRLRDELEPFVTFVDASIQAAHEKLAKARAAIEAAICSLGFASTQPPTPLTSSVLPGVGSDPHGDE